MELHLDPLGGIAGDMFVAAILHARPDLEAGLQHAMALCPLLDGVSLDVTAHDDGILTGKRFVVSRDEHLPHGHHHPHRHDDHKHTHDHLHVRWRDIRSAIEQSSLDADTISHALGIFALLAEAEARVHGVAPEDVSFHEVGAWDSIADIVAAGFLISRLGAVRWTVGALPLGSGRVRTAHGMLPVPAPATALLLEGFLTLDDGVSGERVTPTGAAILGYLCKQDATKPGPRRLVASGHGFGTRTLPGISNCLRVLLFDTDEQTAPDNTIRVIEFDIDDQTAEDLAHAIEHLRAVTGVLDIVQAPVFGKKGRMMTSVRILAEPASLDPIIARIFGETSTIGLRHTQAERAMLPRRANTHEINGTTLRTKTVDRPGGPTTKVEADDLAGIPGRAARDTMRIEAHRAALDKEDT